MRRSSRTISARIHKLSGQLNAIERMIAKRRSCSQILHQVGAVRAGVEKLAMIVFQRELERISSRRKLTQTELQELINLYSKTT